MPSEEKILQLRQLRDRLEKALNYTLGELGVETKLEGATVGAQIDDTKKKKTVATDEELAAEMGLRVNKKEAALLKKGGAPGAVEPTKKADIEALRLAAQQEKLAEEKENELKKEKRALKKMEKLIEEAKGLCKDAGTGAPYDVFKRKNRLNKIIAEIRGNDEVILETEEHIRELHRSLIEKEMEFKRIASVRQSLTARARNAINRAEEAERRRAA